MRRTHNWPARLLGGVFASGNRASPVHFWPSWARERVTASTKTSATYLGSQPRLLSRARRERAASLRFSSCLPAQNRRLPSGRRVTDGPACEPSRFKNQDSVMCTPQFAANPPRRENGNLTVIGVVHPRTSRMPAAHCEWAPLLHYSHRNVDRGAATGQSSAATAKTASSWRALQAAPCRQN